MSTLNTDNELMINQVSFGAGIAGLLGDCFESDDGRVLSFSLSDSLLADKGDGVQAALKIFAELVMGRTLERSVTLARLVDGSFSCAFMATPTSDTIRGEASLISRAGDLHMMRVKLYCQAGLVFSGTAIWSTAR